MFRKSHTACKTSAFGKSFSSQCWWQVLSWGGDCFLGGCKACGAPLSSWRRTRLGIATDFANCNLQEHSAFSLIRWSFVLKTAVRLHQLLAATRFIKTLGSRSRDQGFVEGSGCCHEAACSSLQRHGWPGRVESPACVGREAGCPKGAHVV